MKKLILAFGTLALFLFAGCITMDYQGNQEFRDDGTSVLKTKEYVGISKEFITNYLAAQSGEDFSSSMSVLKLGYYSTEGYPETLCRYMTGVEKCSGGEDGYLYTEKALTPEDKFYAFEKQTDWVNLKEVMVYTIDEAPMGLYYLKDDEAEVKKAVEDATNEYAKSKIGQLLTKDKYCEATGASPLKCTFEGSNIAVFYSPSALSSAAYNIQWVGCAAQDSATLYFKNSTELEGIVSKKLSVNKVANKDTNVSVNAGCGAADKTLVMVYESKLSSTSQPKAGIGLYDIKTKEEVMQELEDSLEPSTTGTESLTSGGYSKAYLDFRKSKFMDSEFEKLGQLTGTGASYNMTVNVEYTAVFPGKITSAEIYGYELEPQGNTLTLDLETLKGAPAGSLKVVVERELSPLGVFTWAVLAIIVVGIAAFLFMKRGNQPQ